MAIAVSQIKHVFGVRTGVNGSVAYQNEHTLVYPSGSNIIVYNIDQKTQKFIAANDKTQKMSAMAISPNRRYLALAITTTEDKPLVVIYDLNSMRKKKDLHLPEGMQAGEFVSIAFSPDSKYLATQTNGQDAVLGYWAWDKSKLLASLKTSTQGHNSTVNEISFNPQDSTQICAVGNLFIKIFRYSENTLKTHGVTKVDLQNFTCHCWVSNDRFVLGTETGKWILMENGEVKTEGYISSNIDATGTAIDESAIIEEDEGAQKNLSNRNTGENTENSANSESNKITAIVSTNKGLAIASGLGRMHWLDKLDDAKVYYKKTREVVIPMDLNSADPSRSQEQIILDICVSPSEESIVICTNRNQLYTYTLSNTEISKIGEQSKFELLSYSFHHSQVLGLDICKRKPILATCSIDRSVRVWNYETNQLELYKEFAEEAYSIALHPSGLYLLVGFSDKLRLMNILIDDIRTFKEFAIRACKECAFSNGGHYFAAVHSNLIQVYSNTNFEVVWSLKGHNNKIRNIIWSADDRKLISCGMDGAIYEWDIYKGNRINEVVNKKCSYTGITTTGDSKTTYAVGTDKSLKEISESAVVREISDLDVQLTTVELSNSGRMLFCGTSNGSVRSFKFPLTQSGEFNEFLGHSAQITKMKITCNDDYLVTISDDCTVMIWRIQDREGRNIKRDKEIGWTEEILITKSDLEEKNSTISDLKTRVEELKSENDYQLKLKDMNYNEKLKELTEKFIQEMESLKTKNQVLKTEKDKEETKHEENLHEMLEKHNKELQDTETGNHQKLMLEYEKYQELQAKSSKMQEDYERQIQNLEFDKEKALEELTKFYETKLTEKNKNEVKLEEEKLNQKHEYEETKRLIEEDSDREILEMKIKYEQKLQNERKINSVLQNKQGIMEKKSDSLKQEIKEKEDEIKRAKSENIKLKNNIESLDKDKVGLNKEIKERDETIQDKEKRIYDLKKKNQELEKFKFVLDYKIKELRKQIEPKDQEITRSKEQIQEMESELERFHSVNKKLTLNIEDLKEKLKTAEKELRSERQNTRDVEAQIRRLKTDLYNCTSYIQDPRGLKESIVALYKKHIQENVTGEASVDADIQKEFTRQREHLEKSVASLQQKLHKDSNMHRSDYVRIMQENVSLIQEINELRAELKETRLYIHKLESALEIRHSKGEEARQLLASVTKVSRPAPLLEREVEENKRLIEAQRALLLKQNNSNNSEVNSRPSSGLPTKLPPIETVELVE